MSLMRRRKAGYNLSHNDGGCCAVSQICHVLCCFSTFCFAACLNRISVQKDLSNAYGVNCGLLSLMILLSIILFLSLMKQAMVFPVLPVLVFDHTV